MKSQTNIERIDRGAVAISCTSPVTGKVGTWLFAGSDHRVAGSEISPVFPGCYELFLWCQANGWVNDQGGGYLKYHLKS